MIWADFSEGLYWARVTILTQFEAEKRDHYENVVL